ncbi:MAG TPA: helix-turn-helix domain-containing protein [Kineosporiaceae bacterium]
MAERTMPAGGTTHRSPATETARDSGTPGIELLRRPDPHAISTPAEFAAALSALRDQAGVAVRDLARSTGVTTSTLEGWFSGRQLPAPTAVPAVEKILTACNVPPGSAQSGWVEALGRVRRLPSPRPVQAREPYRGLESYRIQDAGSFFGRERLVARLVALVTSGQVGATPPSGPTVLVGPSGSGKSSALQAGLAARLVSSNWSVVTLTPGSDPLAALDEALDEVRGRRLPPGSRVALLVDQFEELFTLCPHDTARREFVRRLTAPGHPDLGSRPGSGPTLTVVIALRADSYGAALRYDGLSQALQDRQVVVGPMSADDLRRAVTEPARAAGLQLEPGLVELVLHDLAPAGPPDQPGAGTRPTHDAGALPLMSFALLQAWRRSRLSKLTVEDYVGARGISGAVAAAADAVYDDLTPVQRELARTLFLRLVAIGDDACDTLRRATAAELGLDTAQGDAITEVLERFVAARLLTTTERSVRIAHEAVLAAWPRLGAWLDGDRAGLVTRRRIADAAATWHRDGQDPALLHRGSRLISAREWAADPEHAAVLTVGERQFLAASVAAQHRQDARAGRRVRRLQVLLALVTVLGLAAAGAAAVEYRQAWVASSDQNEAVSRQLAETSVRVRQADPWLAGRIAVQAWRTAQTAEARAALLDSATGPIASPLPGPGGPAAVAASGDGGTLAAVGNRGGLRVWRLARDGDPRATEVGLVPAADAKPLYSVAVGRGGGLVVAAGASGVLHLWDLGPGRPMPMPDVTLGRGAVVGLAVSPDGHTLAATTSDGHVVLHDIAGTRITPIGSPLAAPVGALVQAVAFSADNRGLAAGGTNGRVQLWTIADRAHPVATVLLTGPTAPVTSVAFSPDGRRLVAGARDQRLYLWQLATPAAAPAHLDDASAGVTAAAFSADGGLLAVAAADRHLRVYETSSRVRVADLPHPTAVTGAVFLPGGHTLVSAAGDGVVRLWPSPVPTAAVAVGHLATLGYLDGNRLVAASSRDGLRVFDMSQGYRARPIGASDSPPDTGAQQSGLNGAMAVARSGALVAVSGTDGSVRLAEPPTAANGTAVRQLATLPRTQSGTVLAIALSPDGALLATATDDGSVQLTDVSAPGSPRSLGTPFRVDDGVVGLAFAPDGHRLAVGSAGPARVTLWDVTRPDHPTRLSSAPAAGGPDGSTAQLFSIAYAPDDDTLAVGSDGAVRLLDLSDPRRPAWLGQPLASGDDVHGVAFDPAGRVVAAASGDGTVRLWDVSDRSAPRLSATLTAAGPDPLATVAFDRSGRHLAAGGANPSVWQWDLDPDAAAARICRSAGTVDPQEWARSVPGVRYANPCG